MFTGTRTRERHGRSLAPTAQKAEAGRVPSLVGGYLASKAHLPSRVLSRDRKKKRLFPNTVCDGRATDQGATPCNPPSHP